MTYFATIDNDNKSSHISNIFRGNLPKSCDNDIFSSHRA